MHSHDTVQWINHYPCSCQSSSIYFVSLEQGAAAVFFSFFNLSKLINVILRIISFPQ